ncbi:SMP-30/gluconolactonase/LRE family protein, partial [Streptomyces vinaceus]
MLDLVVRGAGRDDMAELSGGGEPGPAVRRGARRGRMTRRGLVSAAMVVAMVTGGGIASLGEAFAADLPVNISCPQVNACEVVASGFEGFGVVGAVPDDDGNFYAVSYGGQFFKVNPGGVITKIAIGLGASIRGLAGDGDGNYYAVGESGTLRKVTQDGVVTEIATGLGKATDVAVAEDGNFYVVNESGALYKVTQGGVKTQFATGLGGAQGVAVAEDGNFYVSNQSGVLYKVTSVGVKTQVTTGLGLAWGAALDGDGNIYVCNKNVGSLWRVSPDGSKETVATKIGSGTDRAWSVKLDGNGNAYIASFGGNNVWRLGGVGAPMDQAPAAPLISAPKPNAETGAYPVFKGHALAENGSVDADEVQILDANGIVLDKVDVRQSDGYFSWKQNGKWEPGTHELKFVAIRGDLKSDATVLKFTVAPGPVAPVVTKPTD